LAAPQVCLTVDVEPDCPPYLWSWRGIEEGMPRLLALFDRERVPVTFFVTGATAERYPDMVAGIAARGHEIGCHGYSHGSFADFGEAEAEREIRATNAILRAFAPVRSFRAPYLRFPERYLPLLAGDGIAIDASRARYKRKEPPNPAVPQVRRLAASVPTSLTRLPAPLRTPILRALRDPVVLFFHPWEFVDLTRAPIPLDCRFRTGQAALDDLAAVIAHFRARGSEFAYVDPEWRAATRP
jgi:peptidoglycan/xylan/chitin deacetylase (PgdA/CDA1 family)